MCDSKDKMIKSMFFRNMNERHAYEKPCKVMGNVRNNFYESPIANSNEIIGETGEFWLSIKYTEKIFKEIHQTR